MFFTHEQIQLVHEKLLSRDVIEDCYLMAPDTVFKTGFSVLGSRDRVLQIGMDDKKGK